jgi:glycosyltransferase involved in cell wall biosynthesis
MTGDQDPLSIEVYNSVGGAAFFQALLGAWEGAGARVVCHYAVSDPALRSPRGRLGRLALRWHMYAGQASMCWHGVRTERGRSPLRVVTTNPFFAPALVARAARGRGATINLVYDLFPEALIQAGTIGSESWMARKCAAITRFSLRECAATVFLGHRLRAYAEEAHGSARRAIVIPVGADGQPFRDSSPALLPKGVRPRILYAGQMGRMHEVDTLAAVWTAPEAASVDWTFHASGPGYRRLKKVVTLRPGVVLGAALADATWQQIMRQAQVALVTIAAGAERVVMPSKAYSALVAGQAILAICRRTSDLADLVRQHDCGWVVEPGDHDGLRWVLNCIARDPAAVWAKRRNAFEAGHRHYDTAKVAEAWMNLFEDVQEGMAPAGSRAGSG